MMHKLNGLVVGNKNTHLRQRYVPRNLFIKTICIFLRVCLKHTLLLSHTRTTNLLKAFQELQSRLFLAPCLLGVTGINFKMCADKTSWLWICLSLSLAVRWLDRVVFLFSINLLLREADDDDADACPLQPGWWWLGRTKKTDYSMQSNKWKWFIVSARMANIRPNSGKMCQHLS